MNTLAVLSGLLVVGLAIADPIPAEQHTITDSFYVEDFVVYTGENDITKIVVPLNSINFDKNTDVENLSVYAFFVEEGKGLFVLKDGVATKLLDNGKDIASSADDSTQVFFGATDGIYTFNAEKKTAEKYGTLTDNIKNIVVTNGTDEIYILTEDKVFYKVLDQGTKKEEVTSVKDAEQITLDSANDLIFVDSKKRVYVRFSDSGVVKKVKDLPHNPSSLQFIRSPGCVGDAVGVIIDTKLYSISYDGTSEYTGVEWASKATAVSVDAALILYFGHNKKIYQYKLADVIESPEESAAPVKSYLNKNSTNLKEEAKKKTLRQ